LSTSFKKRRAFKPVVVGLYLGVAAIGLVVVGVGSTAHAVIITTPTDLAPGDEYRLAFVTTSTRDASSNNIDDYNQFVTTAANTQAELVALGVTWTAIASTPTVDARDNTGTDASEQLTLALETWASQWVRPVVWRMGDEHEVVRLDEPPDEAEELKP